MIGELVIATYIVECARGYYGYWKEAQRKRRALDSFGEILKHSRTLEELSRNLNADTISKILILQHTPLYHHLPIMFFMAFYANKVIYIDVNSILFRSEPFTTTLTPPIPHKP